MKIEREGPVVLLRMENGKANAMSPTLLERLEGRLWSPREALQLGLVHDVVPEAELLPRAMQRAAALAALPPAGLRMVKESLRKSVAAAARAGQEAQAESWLDGWFSEDSQRRLSQTLARPENDWRHPPPRGPQRGT